MAGYFQNFPENRKIHDNYRLEKNTQYTVVEFDTINFCKDILRIFNTKFFYLINEQGKISFLIVALQISKQ